MRKISDEPIGIRLIRTLLLCDELKLGHKFETEILFSNEVSTSNASYQFQLRAVLGRGSFSTVFVAMERNTDSEVALKKAIRNRNAASQTHAKDFEYLASECQLLKTFNSQSDKLPYLFDNDWDISAYAYMPFLPVGVALPVYAALLNKLERSVCLKQLSDDLQEALSVANRFGYCHCDIRPQNVIFARGVFVLIDWGLARQQGEATHLHIGGLRFYHDDIVRQPFAAIPFKTEYDLASVTYVVFAFMEGKPNLEVPWAFLAGEELIELRRSKCITFNF